MPRQQMFNAIDQARKRRKPAFALNKFIAKVAHAENRGGPAKPGVIKLPGFSVESRQAQMDELDQRNHEFVETLRKNPYAEIVRPEDEEEMRKRKIEETREKTMMQLGLPYIAPLEEEEEEEEETLVEQNNGLYRVAEADNNRALEEFKKTLAGAPKASNNVGKKTVANTPEKSVFDRILRKPPPKKTNIFMPVKNSTRAKAVEKITKPVEEPIKTVTAPTRVVLPPRNTTKDIERPTKPVEKVTAPVEMPVKTVKAPKKTTKAVKKSTKAVSPLKEYTNKRPTALEVTEKLAEKDAEALKAAEVAEATEKAMADELGHDLFGDDEEMVDVDESVKDVIEKPDESVKDVTENFEQTVEVSNDDDSLAGDLAEEDQALDKETQSAGVKDDDEAELLSYEEMEELYPTEELSVKLPEVIVNMVESGVCDEEEESSSDEDDDGVVRPTTARKGLPISRGFVEENLISNEDEFASANELDNETDSDEDDKAEDTAKKIALLSKQYEETKVGVMKDVNNKKRGREEDISDVIGQKIEEIAERTLKKARPSVS